MSFSIEKAVQRIGWRMKENHWKHNEKDVEAFNQIVEYVENAQKKLYDRHELFAKLYIHMYCQYMMSYGGGIHSHVPKKKLNQELSKSTQEHILEFQDHLNSITSMRQLEQVKTKEDLEGLKLKTYDYDFVERNMVKQINEVIFKHQQWKN